MAAQPTEADAERCEAVVRGVVQGVFFRYTTKQQADRLGIAGTVCNWPDGTVHVDATGPRDRLQDLLDWLHVGPQHAVVESVEVTWHTAWHEPASPQTGFRIRG